MTELVWGRDYIDQIICGDCLKVMKGIPDESVDLVVTDPPYPDTECGYEMTNIDFLTEIPCRQLVFWSAKCNFPLDYTAIHIWDKRAGGLGSFYERIFERNGTKEFKVFNYISVNNTVRANFAQDKLFGHPSQKPIKLIKKLVSDYSNKNDLILDPFLGSGTTAVACKELDRHYIGIEINSEYCEIARKRVGETRYTPTLF